MKIVFFGSDDFAQVHLGALIDSEHEVCACVTQPDKPKGRGMKMVVSPIKASAQKHNIDVLQPTDLVSIEEELKSCDADLFVVIAYGRFLPESTLSIPKHFCINVHSSLLPKYRGAAPINWAIINGETTTGISIIKLIKEMDAGDVVSSVKLDIKDDDTAQSLRERMMKEGPKLLLDTVKFIENGSFKLQPQDNAKASLAPKLTKELGQIDWSKSAVEINNLIRGLIPWPSAYSEYNGKLLKILAAEVINQSSDSEPGTILNIDKKGIVIQAGASQLLVSKVHFQDSKPMDALSFANGQRLETGIRLGS